VGYDLAPGTTVKDPALRRVAEIEDEVLLGQPFLPVAERPVLVGMISAIPTRTFTAGECLSVSLQGKEGICGIV
jgi:hypothetical protein